MFSTIWSIQNAKTKHRQNANNGGLKKRNTYLATDTLE